jgi:predicted DNA-binding protein
MIRMKQGIKVTFSVKMKAEYGKKIRDLVKRTGETRSDLFQRIIDCEVKRVTNGESISESINKNLESILGTFDRISPLIDKSASDSSAVRNGANTILSGIFFIMKEMFRTMHFLAKFYSKTSGLDTKQISAISNDANIDAAKSFNMFFKTLTESKPKDIVDYLAK